MHKKTADEFHRRKRHDLNIVAIPVIPPLEADDMLIHGNDAIVVYGGFMSIPAQVFNNIGRLFKWLLAIHHPLFFVE